MKRYKGRGPKPLILAIVIIMSVGFTIAMATVITDSLVIKSKLSVNPSLLNVVFSSDPNKVVEGNVSPYSLTPTPSEDSWFEASDAIIKNGMIPTISNFKMQFEEPGNKVVYKFYAINKGNINAYLTSIIFNNAIGESTNKICEKIAGTTNDISSLCNSISLKVNVGNEVATSSKTIKDHMLPAGSSELITITIEFLNTVTITPDMGDFLVKFGDISLIYSELNNGSSGVETGGGTTGSDVETGGGTSNWWLSNSNVLITYNSEPSQLVYINGSIGTQYFNINDTDCHPYVMATVQNNNQIYIRTTNYYGPDIEYPVLPQYCTIYVGLSEYDMRPIDVTLDY